MPKLCHLVFALLLPFSVVQAAPELVMHEQVTIEARQGDDAIRISSGRGFDCIYERDGCRLTSASTPRRMRWFGSMGIYDPAAGDPSSPAGCKGLSRPVVGEGQIHFDDLNFAQEWIRRRPASATTVWTNDGLLVSWAVNPARNQFNADVWLMCINGKRPTRLSGATDSSIKISPNPSSQAIQNCATVDKVAIAQTRTQLEQDWAKLDKWAAEGQARTQKAKN